MNEVDEIKTIKERIEVIEEILAEAAGGNLTARIPVDVENPDLLTALETGINLLVSDLETEIQEKIKLSGELETLRKG